jgi:hypothetical protein
LRVIYGILVSEVRNSGGDTVSTRKAEMMGGWWKKQHNRYPAF